MSIPCTFCGGKPRVTSIDRGGNRDDEPRCHAFCAGCGATGPTAYGGNLPYPLDGTEDDALQAMALESWDRLMQTRTAAAARWIPVSERLPEPEPPAAYPATQYFVRHASGECSTGARFTKIANGDPNGFVTAETDLHRLDPERYTDPGPVVAWMEIPPLPEESQP